MIQRLISKVEKIQKNIERVGDVVGDVVSERQDVILSLNKDQMLLGRDAEGSVLSPSYLNDPYFKTPNQAQRYAGMKYSLESKHRAMIENPTLYPSKDKNTPNLIVTGPFQGGMFIRSSVDSFTIGSTYRDSGEIDSKYRGVVFGLSPESKEFFYNHYLKERLKSLIYGVQLS